MRRTAAVAAVLLALPLLAPAAAVPPAGLAVFSAESFGTPVGVVSRVPAESPGGLLRSSTLLRLGKSQAQAAGATLGPLGDTFLVTSQPAPLFRSVPSVVNAQDPPSEEAPRENSFRQGADAPQVQGGRLRARADDDPSASADASGTGTDATVVRTAAASSSSESTVSADGTVTTVATAVATGVRVGPPGAAPLLSLGSVRSRAAVTVRPGRRPVAELDVQVTGALLGGVPVEVGDEGVTVAGSVVAPASSVAAVDAALAALEERGLSLVAVPTQRVVTAEGASVSGGALALRYRVPDAGAPRPSDVGTDQTVVLGSVGAVASARERQPLALPLTAAPSAPAAGTAGPAGALPGQPETTVGVPALDPGDGPAAPAAPGAAPVAVASAPAQAPALPVAFSLPDRPGTSAVDRLVAAYLMFLLAAGTGTAALLLLPRLAARR